MKKKISILGSTGSIGKSTLRVVENYPERFEVLALGKNLQAALEQAKRWRPKLMAVSHEADAEDLQKQLRASGLHDVAVVSGAQGTVQVATHPDSDFVVSAIV